MVGLGFHLKKHGLRDTTIIPMLKALRILGGQADLENPEARKLADTILNEELAVVSKK